MKGRSQSGDFIVTFLVAVAVTMILVTLLMGLIYGVIRASQRGTIKPGARVEPVQIEEYTPAEKTA